MIAMQYKTLCGGMQRHMFRYGILKNYVCAFPTRPRDKSGRRKSLNEFSPIRPPTPVVKILGEIENCPKSTEIPAPRKNHSVGPSHVTTYMGDSDL